MSESKEMRDYRIDIEIDENNLEDEWITHPSIYVHYSDLYADAVFRRDEAKLYLDWVDANLDLAIRKDYKKYGFESKPTEGGIRNKIITNKKHMEAAQKFNSASKSVNSMTGVKTAFEHRKHALGNLVSLKIGGFNAEPRNKIRDIKKLMSGGVHEKHKQSLNERMKNRIVE